MQMTVPLKTILEVCKLTFFIDFLIHIYFTNNKVEVSGIFFPRLCTQLWNAFYYNETLCIIMLGTKFFEHKKILYERINYSGSFGIS